MICHRFTGTDITGVEGIEQENTESLRAMDLNIHPRVVQEVSFLRV